MKQKVILILYFIMLPLLFYAQTMDNNNSMYKKLNKEINFSKTETSNIVWERIPVQEGFNLSSFLISDDGNLYIGNDYKSNLDGIFQSDDLGITWNSLGLANGQINFIRQNSNNDLVVGRFSKIYMYTDSVWTEMYQSTIGVGVSCYSIDSLLFAGGGGVIKSDDDGYNWNVVYEMSGGEDVKAFTSTTPDSIFMGSTNWLGLGGGVYLSTDGGENWNHFGLSQHFVKSMATDNNNIVYAGNGGHWETGQGGLYRYNYETTVWDTLFYFPYIWSIVFNSENHIFTGFSTTTDYWGGVMHSEDNGETWILDTVGIGNTNVSELQIDNNGFLYALTGYTTKKLYRTALPVGVKKKHQHQNHVSHCYPNPANNYINITFEPVTQSTNELYFKIYSIVGNTLIEKKLSASEIEKGIISLDISNLKSACYLYSINGNNYYSNNKFTKQ